MRNFVRPGKVGPDKRPYGAVLVVAAIAVVMIATAVVTTAIAMIAATVVVVAIAIVMTAATVVIAAVVIVTAGAVVIATVGVMITVTIVVTAHLAHAVVIIAIAAMAQAASAAVLNHNLPRIGRYICHGLRQSKGAGHGKNCGEKENTVHLYVSCVGHLWRIKAFTPELFVKMRGAGPKAVDRAPAILTNTGSRQWAGKEIGIGFIRGNYAADGMAINPSLGPWPDLGRM